MDLYSLALAGSMLALGTALLATVSQLRRPPAGNADGGRSAPVLLGIRRWNLSKVARVAAIVSLFLVALSIGSHLILGHRPGTASALGPMAFLAEHRAFVVIPVIAVVALWVARHRGTRA
jgi:hypothetical protein